MSIRTPLYLDAAVTSRLKRARVTFRERITKVAQIVFKEDTFEGEEDVSGLCLKKVGLQGTLDARRVVQARDSARAHWEPPGVRRGRYS